MIFKNKLFVFSIIVVSVLFNYSCKIAGFQVICLSEKSLRTVSLYDDDNTRIKKWAEPLKREGVPNLFKVSAILYRGGQPEKEGFIELKELGIKTIIDLSGSKKDKKRIKGFDFIYKQIPIDASSPEKSSFLTFLELMANPDLHPVFVHCWYGADRTGAAVALYRIKMEDWDVDEAIVEMVLGGYRFHRKYASILSGFIRSFDKQK